VGCLCAFVGFATRVVHALRAAAGALYRVVARRRVGRSTPGSRNFAARARGARLQSGGRHPRDGARCVARARRRSLGSVGSRRGLRTRRHPDRRRGPSPSAMGGASGGGAAVAHRCCAAHRAGEPARARRHRHWHHRYGKHQPR
jgi:hypothetical protein